MTSTFNFLLPTVLVDTCIFLDSFQNISEKKDISIPHLKALQVLASEVKNDNINSIISSTVHDEYLRNISVVISDLEKSIEAINNRIRFFENICKLLSNENAQTQNRLFPLQDASHQISRWISDIIDKSIKINPSDNCKSKAADRAAINKRPGRRGAIGDCLIIESYFEFIEARRMEGYSQPSVFITSNTKDYSSDKKNLHTDLQVEFSNYALLHSFTLPHAIFKTLFPKYYTKQANHYAKMHCPRSRHIPS